MADPTNLIQDLNTVIWGTADALLDTIDVPVPPNLYDPSDIGPPASWAPGTITTDPVTGLPTGTRNPGVTASGGTAYRSVPQGGWGYQPSKNRKPNLTITAANESKNQGDTFTFTGAEFSAAGLRGADTVTSVSLTSPGADASAAAGTYPITPSAAVGTGLSKYRTTYVRGTMTVTAGDQFVQGSAASYGAVDVPKAVALAGVTAGDLLVLAVWEVVNFNTFSDPRTVALTDGHGTAYLQAGTYLSQYDGANTTYTLSLWYAIAGVSGDYTVTAVPSSGAGGLPSDTTLAYLEYRGVNAVPLDGVSTNSSATPTLALGTGPIPVSGPGRLLVGAFGGQLLVLLTPDPGVTDRVNELGAVSVADKQNVAVADAVSGANAFNSPYLAIGASFKPT